MDDFGAAVMYVLFLVMIFLGGMGVGLNLGDVTKDCKTMGQFREASTVFICTEKKP